MKKVEEMIKAVKKNYEYGDEKKGAILEQMLKMPGMIERIDDLYQIMSKNDAVWRNSGQEVLPTDYVESMIDDTVNYYIDQSEEEEEEHDDLEHWLCHEFDDRVAADFMPYIGDIKFEQEGEEY